MDETYINTSQRSDKKLVDLIYLDQYQDSADLTNIYQAKINTWLDWMNQKLNKVAFENLEAEEQDEYFVANHYLRRFLSKRLEWILESVSDSELKQKYLLVLPPFNQQGGIKSFFLHFFKFKSTQVNKEIEFSPLNSSEKEIRILWDIYKLVKTIDTVTVLKKSLSGSNPFRSRFSVDHVKETLNTVENMLNLLIQICVKPEHYNDIRHQFPLGVFKAEAILNRKETNNFLINVIAIEKFDYRNYFFHIYYKPSMKAKYKGKNLAFKYNFLDFEIMRQEFLMHWLNSRLKNNPRKMEVLNNYMLGQRKFSEVIQKSPEMEIQLLKKLPGDVFNDLIAHVNDAVDLEDKTQIDPLSQNFGEYAKQFELFGKAKELTQKTTQAIREYVTSVKQNIAKTIIDTLPVTNKPPVEEPLTPKSSFQIKLLKKEEIDFPFFNEDYSDYNEQLSQFEKNMTPEQLQSFNRQIRECLSSADEDSILKRRIPRQERALPFLIKEKTAYGVAMQLLILGIDSQKDLTEANANEQTDNNEPISYFVYGSKIRNFEMGEPAESRSIMDKPFFIYQPSSVEVIKKALLLMDVVLKNEV